MSGHTLVEAVEGGTAEEGEVLTLFAVVDGVQMPDVSVSFRLFDAAVSRRCRSSRRSCWPRSSLSADTGATCGGGSAADRPANARIRPGCGKVISGRARLWFSSAVLASRDGFPTHLRPAQRSRSPSAASTATPASPRRRRRRRPRDGRPRRGPGRPAGEHRAAPLRRADRRGRGRFSAMGLARPWLDRHGRRTDRLRLAGTRGGAGRPLHGESAIVEVFYGVFRRVPEARSANMRPPVADYDAPERMMGDPHLSRQFSLADAPGGVPGADFAHKLINQLCVRVCLPTNAGLINRVDRVLRVVSAAYRHQVTGFDARRVVAEMARDFVATKPPTELAFQHKPAQGVVSPPRDDAPVAAGVTAALREQAAPVPHGPAEFVFDCVLQGHAARARDELQRVPVAPPPVVVAAAEPAGGDFFAASLHRTCGRHLRYPLPRRKR